MNKDEKCIKNNCSACQEWLKERLSKCEDWEMKRKESYRRFELRFCQTNSGRNWENEISYPETGGYSYLPCPQGCKEMGIKKNDFGDQTELKHECQHSNQSSKFSSITARGKEISIEPIKQYLIQNHIKSIILQDNNLLITYQNGETKQIRANSQQLQQIKSYCQEKPNKTVKLEELNNNNQQASSPKPNYLPWILGGVGLVSLIGLVVYFATRKENK